MNEPYQIPKRKRIPYGMMNFVDVREDDCYFVDKTVFIPTLEASNKFFSLSVRAGSVKVLR